MFDEPRDFDRCEQCGNTHLAASRLKWKDWPWVIFGYVLGFRPYRCMDCYDRRWLWKLSVHSGEPRKSTKRLANGSTDLIAPDMPAVGMNRPHLLVSSEVTEGAEEHSAS